MGAPALHVAAHHKASLIVPLLPMLLPLLYQQTVIKVSERVRLAPGERPVSRPIGSRRRLSPVRLALVVPSPPVSRPIGSRHRLSPVRLALGVAACCPSDWLLSPPSSPVARLIGSRRRRRRLSPMRLAPVAACLLFHWLPSPPSPPVA
eukprot:1180340-Prorocentrum_minimum.AAC.1